MTSLLAISALYIVVFGNIPLLGYLTNLDKYVVSMFVLLACCVVAHQGCVVLHRRVEDKPIRAVLTRAVESTGRLGVFPSALLLFMYYFAASKLVKNMRTMALTVLIIILTFVFISEVQGVRKEFSVATRRLKEKVDIALKKKLVANFVNLNYFCHFTSMVDIDLL